MARLDLVPQTIPGRYPATPLDADEADLTFTPAGAAFADGAGFPLTGREVLIVRNANAGAQTVTIDSVPDAKNREGDITAYSIGAGEIAAFGPFPVAGWKQSADGELHFEATATDVEFAVVRLPSIP